MRCDVTEVRLGCSATQSFLDGVTVKTANPPSPRKGGRSLMAKQLRRQANQSTLDPRDAFPGAITIAGYHQEARKTDRLKNARDLSFGFFGEVGGLLSALKKQKRDQLVLSDPQAVSEELGDALWYLVNLAGACDFLLEDVAAQAWAFLRQHFGESSRRPPAPLTFRSLEGLCAQHHAQLSRQGSSALQLLAKAAGTIVSDGVPKRGLSGAPQEQQAILGQLLAALVLVCARHRLSLEAIAYANLQKTMDRWPGQAAAYQLPQNYGEPHEQFPEELQITFMQRRVGNRVLVFQRLNKVNIGDPLTDNSHRADGYRFHDAFHIAYAVHLGWSPVLRALLKLKRKSDSRIDENEDGARAVIIEEGIATWIFNHSLRQSPKYYADVEEGRLDYFLLKQVRSLVAGFEVEAAPLWQWEKAILDGFRIFRLLLDNKGGTIVADLKKHTMNYIEPEVVRS